MRRPASQPPELPGYTYVRLLGSGGFADVFLYEQKLPKRRVAVKVLLTEEVTPASRAAFVAEANLMAQLSAHPYIVTIYQADVAADARPYLVMEYCPGPSLAERYKQETFEVADALRTGVRLSSAVATAHAAGILHRDIKPANVLTNDFGWPALTDFGISSAVDDALPIHTSTLAQAMSDSGTNGGGQSVGMSVPWSPPEMFEEDPQPDVRSDVFALAATVYTILAGQTPFEVRGRSNGTLDLMGRIERGAITPMERDDVPRSLIALLTKGMAVERSRRFASAVDFARALQRVELELGYSPTAIDVPNLVVAPEERPGADSGDDETRVRSVTAIAIQPAAPQPTVVQPLQPSPLQQKPAEAEETRVRLPATIEQTRIRPRSIATSAEPEQSEATEPAPSGGRRVGLIVAAAVVAVLVIGGVLAAVILPGLSAPTPAETSSAGGGVITVSTVPTPVLVSKQAAADGTSVTFVWRNPKPRAGDQYLWARAETPDKKSLLNEPQVVVSGVVPGSTVCISVEVLRAGRTSPNPLEVCNP